MTRRDSFTLLKRQLDKQGMLPSSSKIKDTKISKTEKNSPTRVAVDDQKEENQHKTMQIFPIGMWKQFKENKQQALENYTKALSLGGTCTLPELYEAAGLPFDFSPERIKVLMDMVRDELQKLD
jgi:hypothetical protein